MARVRYSLAEMPARREEVEHAEKFIAYLYERGARVIIPDVAKPKETYADALEAFKAAYPLIEQTRESYSDSAKLTFKHSTLPGE